MSTEPAVRVREEMSPEDLLRHLTRNRREEEFMESRVRAALDTDVPLTDQQLENLYNMLKCLDNAFDNTARNYARMALEAGITDRRLVASMHAVLSEPRAVSGPFLA